jgi:hypothetical protein
LYGNIFAVLGESFTQAVLPAPPAFDGHRRWFSL